jgi:hypothetical protein
VAQGRFDPEGGSIWSVASACCEVALCRPHHCHDTQILGVVDRIGYEAAQLPERVQVSMRQVQLAVEGVDFRPPPQIRQRAVEGYHATPYWEKWVSSAATRFPAGSSLDGTC